MENKLQFIRKALLILSVLFIFISCFDQKGKRNNENSKKLKVGMTKQEMLNIMGNPDNIRDSYYNDSCILYLYDPPFAASSGIDIYIDTFTNRIKHITYFE